MVLFRKLIPKILIGVIKLLNPMLLGTNTMGLIMHAATDKLTSTKMYYATKSFIVYFLG